jgi:uncharacterized protein (DUF58 family)
VRRAAGIVLAGALLILAAYVFEAVVLFVPGVALVLVGVLTPPWIGLAARGTKITRAVHADRVVEDQPVEATIHVDRGPLGLPGVELLDPLVRDVLTQPPVLTPVRGGPGVEARIVARFSRRGRRRFEPPALALGDPLGLVRIVRAGSSSTQEVLVLPRTERVRWARPDGGERLGSAAASALIEALAATDVDGLRPYRPGTPASRISWPALARGAGLLERRLRADRENGPLVALDVRCAGAEANVDAAVRAAASLTLELARRTGCDLLLPGERRPVHVDPDLGAWEAAHARLAVVEGGPDAPPPWIDSRSRLGQIFYVAAESDRAPAAVLRGERRAIVVLPETVEPPFRHVLGFEVSGCRGYLIGVATLTSRRRERAA